MPPSQKLPNPIVKVNRDVYSWICLAHMWSISICSVSYCYKENLNDGLNYMMIASLARRGIWRDVRTSSSSLDLVSGELA